MKAKKPVHSRLAQAQVELANRPNAIGLLGQASVEFMVALGIILLLFAFSLVAYVNEMEEAARLHDAMEASRICMLISSPISALAAGSGNANASLTLSLPPYLNGKNYTAYVAAQSGLVKIDYGTAGVGCGLPRANVTNSSSATLFRVNKTSQIRAANGGVVFVP